MKKKVDEEIPEEKKNVSYTGSSTSKLKALIKKNLLVLKRNKLTTSCEIFFSYFINDNNVSYKKSLYNRRI